MRLNLLLLIGSLVSLPAALAHRIDSLSATAGFSADGTRMDFEISAEAIRILSRTEGLSMLPRFSEGGAAAEEVTPSVFAKAAEYFPPRVELWFDGKPVPFPRLEFVRLEVDEKDAVDPAQAATATDRKHVFIVGRWSGPVPPNATTYQMNVTGDSVVAVGHKVAGKPVGRLIPQFPGMQSRPFPVPRAVAGEPDSEVKAVQAAEAAAAALEPGFWYYVHQGFLHILPLGLDHILFVLALFLLATKLKPLVIQVTMFTLAHSITLALAMLDVVRLPDKPVEVLIAASIAFVAIENLFRDTLSRWRPAVIFALGLVHGLGFAGAFKELLGGVPTADWGAFIRMIVGFNIGVELGQLAVIGLAFLAVGWAWPKPWYRRVIVVPVSLVIAGCGIYWAVTRMLEPAA
ncbi:MAG: HupE/UreJ family protein [Verrucomicrobiales bacterium]